MHNHAEDPSLVTGIQHSRDEIAQGELYREQARAKFGLPVVQLLHQDRQLLRIGGLLATAAA